MNSSADIIIYLFVELELDACTRDISMWIPMEPPPYMETKLARDEPQRVAKGVIVTGLCEWIRDDFQLWGTAANALTAAK